MLTCRRTLPRYIKTTHGHTHSTYTLELQELYRVERKDVFNEGLSNHMLLWHGSRLTNWAGILGQVGLDCVRGVCAVLCLHMDLYVCMYVVTVVSGVLR